MPTPPPVLHTATFYLTDGSTEVLTGLNATAISYISAYATGAWQLPQDENFYGASKLYTIGAPGNGPATIINWDQVVKVKFS